MTESVDVAIVGSGFSGLGAAINLKREGRDDFVVLERAEEVGGTWWANTYPGCACDVPSHLYSFSFALNPDWSEAYPKQPEIRDYLIRCSNEYGVRPHIRFGTDVTDARWDEDRQRWAIATGAGDYDARVLVVATGQLFEPRIPDFPGIDEFEGETWHSARWNHDYDLAGKKVVSIGTGASAIQLIPEIQPQVDHLTVVQRTPPWVLPQANRVTTRFERTVFRRVPALQRLLRGAVYTVLETFVLGFVKNPRVMGLPERLAKRHIAGQLGDRADLVERVTPDYALGCKRMLLSNKWYPALAQDNVDLVTAPIKEFTRRSVVFEDGTEVEADAVVFSTGFRVSEIPSSRLVRDAQGRTLHDVWNGSARAHRGTAVAGFPNMFMLLGPNTGLGHSSMVYMAESQIAYLMDALRTMDREGATAVELRAEAQKAYNDRVQKKLEGTVWNTGCASWYMDEQGRNVTLWPDFTFVFRRQTEHFDAGAYELQPLREQGREAVTA